MKLMFTYGLPVSYALFLWWFSTGVVIVLDRLPARTYVWSMIGATVVAMAALYGLSASSVDASVAGAYCAFSCALLVWGWNELSFLLGFVTGPRHAPCPSGVSGWARFRYATATLIYHEVAILGTGALILALTANGENQFGAWTFAILWGMRLSAKLNVFFGVPNLTEELLPDHLKYLQTYFRNRPMNMFFPVSITVSMILVVWIAGMAGVAPRPFESVGYLFLLSLMSLAILEHWFLVLPLSSVKLWSWSMGWPKGGPSLESAHGAEPKGGCCETRLEILEAKTGR
jgi:putative photosynthetic complex assembly protein 2